MYRYPTRSAGTHGVCAWMAYMNNTHDEACGHTWWQRRMASLLFVLVRGSGGPGDSERMHKGHNDQ